ncbi:MAG: hypothetical protein ACI9BD_000663 [Candidatus Marinamargulisbacteria bacterium]|jgi:hypothetical protein
MEILKKKMAVVESLDSFYEPFMVRRYQVVEARPGMLSPSNVHHHVLARSDYLCVGESHVDPSARAWLRQALPGLVKTGVTAIGLEFFSMEDHKDLLDAFASDPSAKHPPKSVMGDFLANIGIVVKSRAVLKRVFQETIALLCTAKAMGIKIIPLENSASLATLSKLEDRAAVLDYVGYQHLQAEKTGKMAVLAGLVHVVGELNRTPGFSRMFDTPSIFVQTRLHGGSRVVQGQSVFGLPVDITIHA